MSLEEQSRAPQQQPPANPGQLELREGELWRTSLLFLVLLATALAVTSWDSIRSLPRGSLDLENIPLGVLALVVLFVGYVWHKKREIEQLRGFVRAMQEREQAPPTEEQLQQLTEILIRSQQGYRELIDSFDDLVFALSIDGRIRSANRRMAEVFDLPFAELVGRKLDDLVDEPTRATMEKALPRFLERRHWSGTIRVRLKSGSVRFFECVLHPILKPESPGIEGDSPSGRVVGVGGIARDVTQLRESETRFAELFETLQEGVYFTTPEGKFLDANPALVEMLGYPSKEALLCVNVQDLYWDPSERPARLKQFEDATRAHSQEITLRRADGRPIVCLDTSTAIRDTMGRVVRYQGTLLDITHRREMEKRLREEQEFARRMVDCFPDSIVVMDTQGRYTYVSPKIQEQLGYSPEELMGKTMGERTDPEDRVEMQRVFEELVTGKTSITVIEYRTRHKNGNWRRFRASAGPLVDAEGRITGVIASARDVTELKQLEQQVIQSEKLAAMGQMIAGVAHELNNPLTAILGVTDLLRERLPDETAKRQAELAHQQARRAAEIVQNLLAFARPPALKKSRVSLNDLVRRTMQLHEYALRVNNITVQFIPQPDLPAVTADPNQLVQVFLNLIINAEQAIRESRDRGTLTVKVGRGKDQALVILQDDGPGIRPDILPKIFDPFFTTKRPGRGTGLGLSICLAIIKEHGGTIDVQSTEGSGTTFTVSLPLVRAEEVPAATRESKADEAVLRTLHPGDPGFRVNPAWRVLVVEDEPSIRELVHDGLTARGIAVECVASGEEAVGRVRQKDGGQKDGGRYDLVLCDLKMPGMGGEQVFERLRSRQDGSPQGFLFMTGDLADANTLEFLQSNKVCSIPKPFKISELVKAMRDAIEAASRPESFTPVTRGSG
jgi:PAS domain S-box-containing protein